MLLQIVSGRHKQATSVLLLSTGLAVVYADQLIGSGRSIGGVGKVRKHYGVLLSETFLTIPKLRKMAN